jgi:ribonuclease HII
MTDEGHRNPNSGVPFGIFQAVARIANTVELARFDEELSGRGRIMLAGMDEAGRGPWAGPVVAAAVMLPPGTGLAGIADSKLLTPKQREKAFAAVMARALAVGVGISDHREIDRTDILRATFRAMGFALCGLKLKPGLVLVDGNHRIKHLPARLESLEQLPVVDGDAKSLCVAAASIVAKCLRDSIMTVYDQRYPGYGFARHKGYGTREHREALARLGPCPIHRTSYAPVRALMKG